MVNIMVKEKQDQYIEKLISKHTLSKNTSPQN